MSKMKETIKNRKIVEDKIIELEKSKTELSSEINKLKTEKGIEEVIRENYGVAKEGENMIMITDDKNSTAIQPKTDEESFFSFLKNLFE
jgi:cell division protein FtsB